MHRNINRHNALIRTYVILPIMVIIFKICISDERKGKIIVSRVNLLTFTILTILTFKQVLVQNHSESLTNFEKYLYRVFNVFYNARI